MFWKKELRDVKRKLRVVGRVIVDLCCSILSRKIPNEGRI